MRPTRSRNLRFATAVALGGLAVLAATLTVAPAAHAQVAYALSANFATGGTNLISFNLSSPTTLLSNVALSGASASMSAIDFRVTNGVLYGYSAPGGGGAGGRVYTINTSTGVTTAVTTTNGPTSTDALGMDFNPTTGTGQSTLFRIVSAAGENVVYDVTAPGTPPTVATPLQYAAGDVGAASGRPLGVVDNAYTNNVVGATATQQYGIDYQTNSLVMIANNAGTLNTVGNTLGNLGVTVNNAGGFVGFDIFSALGSGGVVSNNAYAILDTTPSTGNAGTLSNFYSINLVTGAATLLGRVGGGSTSSPIYSLAITGTAAPEPGSLALLAGGVLPLAVGIIRRRRRAS